tara:strand:- start:179 stop:1204 length:1026 start_codon:yes stop_codon:yes gene_type:complete
MLKQGARPKAKPCVVVIPTKEKRERKRKKKEAEAAKKEKQKMRRNAHKTTEEEEDDWDSDGMVDAIEPTIQPSAPHMVKKTNGEWVTFIKANYDIITMLNDIFEYQDLNSGCVEKWTGIDLMDPANEEYRRALMHNSGIIWNDTSGGEFTIRRRASHGVENYDDLCHLFNVRLPNGLVVSKERNLSVLTIREDELHNTYEDVHSDIDRLCASGLIGYFFQGGSSESSSGESSSSSSLPVYYKVPPGVPTDPSLCALWNSIPIPSRNEMRKELIESEERTKKEYDARDARKRSESDKEKGIREAAKEAKKDAKKDAKKNRTDQSSAKPIIQSLNQKLLQGLL